MGKIRNNKEIMSDPAFKKKFHGNQDILIELFKEFIQWRIPSKYVLNSAVTQFDLSGSIIVSCGYPLPPLKFTIFIKHFDLVFYWINHFQLNLVWLYCSSRSEGLFSIGLVFPTIDILFYSQSWNRSSRDAWITIQKWSTTWNLWRYQTKPDLEKILHTEFFFFCLLTGSLILKW